MCRPLLFLPEVVSWCCRMKESWQLWHFKWNIANTVCSVSKNSWWVSPISVANRCWNTWSFWSIAVLDMNYTLSGISNGEQFTCEMQSVRTTLTAAQDHMADDAKNYPRKLGGRYIWDVMVETGEVAAAVLVSTTKAKEIAHTTEQLAQRPNFCWKLLYCDTWPQNKEFWAIIFGQNTIVSLYYFTSCIESQKAFKMDTIFTIKHYNNCAKLSMIGMKRI